MRDATASWQKSPLGELADIAIGGTPSRDIENYWASDRIDGFPWVAISDLHGRIICETKEQITAAGVNNSNVKLVTAGTVLMSFKLSLGRVAFAGRDLFTNEAIAAFKSRGEVAEDFFFYVLPEAVRTSATDVAIKGATLNKESLKTLRISYPCKAVQERITAILSAIDTAIEKTEALIAKYQQIKAGLMHDLFTRGVLPNGQLRPPREQAPELYQETAIGWIPREWRVECASTLCSLITKGTTPASDEMWQEGDGIRFLRVDNLTFDGQISYDASSFRIALKTHLGDLARSRCLPGDVLTNIVGPPLGKVGVISEQTGEVNINQAIAVFRPRDGLNSGFLLQWLTTETVKQWFLQRAKQTSGQLNLTLAMCQELPVPSMGLHEQELILARAQGCERVIQSEWSKLRSLKSQKSGLVRDLLTGKVPVKVEDPEVVDG